MNDYFYKKEFDVETSTTWVMELDLGLQQLE